MQTRTVQTVGGECLERASLTPLDYAGTNLVDVLPSGASSAVLAFEAKEQVHEWESPELVVSLDDREVFTYRIPLSITSVDEMYQFGDLRAAARDPSHVPSVPTLAWEQATERKDLDVFFTHGFNVNLADAREWGRHMFKRLWHAGSNARFHMLTWEGDYSWLPGDLFNGLHYQHDVWYALRTGGAFKRYVEAAQPDANKRILMAQSLGNMVVCEALKEGLHADKYFMFDAAIPSEALDGTLQDADAAVRAKYVPADWEGYDPLSWAANWHRWFSHDATDARGKMGWPDYFTAAIGNAANIYNYYSSGDDVFKEFNTVPSRFDGLDVAIKLYCWQKQETLKGSAVLTGTAYGGWAFHQWTIHELVQDIGGGSHYEDRTYRYSSEDAARMIADGSITNNPVFNSDFSPMFDSDASLDDQRLALGKYVPAVSSPVGGTAVFEQDDNVVDMNDSDVGIPRLNGWGRDVNHRYGLDW